MEIRHATAAEIPALCDFMWKSYARQDLLGTIYESDSFPVYFADRYDAGDLFLVMTERGNNEIPLGFAHVVPTDKALHLNHLIVRSSARGAGLGSRILSHVRKRAEGEERCVTLDVHSRNSQARRLYKNHGFKITNVTPVAMYPRRSGSQPRGLVSESPSYKKYGFCHIKHNIAGQVVTLGIVGTQTIRLQANELSINFDWPGFLDWAQWGNLFVYGVSDPIASGRVAGRWEVIRMER